MSKTKTTLSVGNKNYQIYSLKKAKELGLANIDKLPRSMKVLLENLLRHENGTTVVWDDVKAVDQWAIDKKSNREIAYHPARVVMQDFTGVPAVVDLAAMREAMKTLGGDVEKINPLCPVDLVIDHSVMVGSYGQKDSFEKNVKDEYEQNMERYRFLKWGQKTFKNFRVVPPGTGIIHQVNLEYLAQVVWTKGDVAYPDTCVGTDSHTTMINGLSVLGWGVGGIEAEAAMLGQPVAMLIPEVVGFKLHGKLKEGLTATDLVLEVVQRLRKHGVVEKFVEFYGPGMKELSLADRATLANMAPEYGATCGFFPIDEKTIEYLKLSGREEDTVKLVEAYAKEQGLWSYADEADPVFSSFLELDLSTVEPCISGPSRPQDKIFLKDGKAAFDKAARETFKYEASAMTAAQKVEGKDFTIKNGDVVIAAITSCTNTSNPAVLVAAGLVAKKAHELGLTSKPWVKTSLAPGSKVVTDYLVESGLQTHLDAMGFNLVGYGCTTCIGNSGPLMPEISKTINDHKMLVTAVLSGNRNFEGRISPDVKANYLASPPLVVIYAIAGTMNIDLNKEPIGKDKNGKDVFMKDLWPANDEIANVVNKHITGEMYKKRYSNVFEGDQNWQNVKAPTGEMFDWEANSTYIRCPNYFDDIAKGTRDGFKLDHAKVLALFGDSVTTDHISPAGNIAKDSPAAKYLDTNGVPKKDYNSYGSRRGNHEVMMRGTFANIRIKNEMLGGVEGGLTLHHPSKSQMTIYDAAMKYKEEKKEVVVFGGKEYGTGSSRDWAAKGPFLQGVKAVIVESFERIHRSNLVGMGILPLQFKNGETRKTFNLKGDEEISLSPVGDFKPRMDFELTIHHADGNSTKTTVMSRIDTLDEISYFNNGGILQYVLRNLKNS
ncbi:MAG: aconitate hydratase AcnA [Bdellovibrio sp. CG12_big_fil_rev_8_21_14_0_65_39_13]|nr:MAG: aconitate hydratase AcnA [Bdellovibrio sp. CG22_combo_CG10-13_8_21_14_all_39_27]PIQ61157.1 MAG: aconitate hydratase AcnA [Bdellovibrio sp. CG12_big_fil_rev_8_21_14_0_65_39_13]PIR34829.1 MAG: aconitate hydratase AcnA [Bdellovibrio sp. CG11_big_fil_rev_8_21_14_0_20_39_38]